MDEITEATYSVTADELRQFIERFERLELEKREIADQQKEVMAEAKGRGYDTKVMRKIITLRKRDKNDIAEEEAALEAEAVFDRLKVRPITTVLRNPPNTRGGVLGIGVRERPMRIDTPKARASYGMGDDRQFYR